VTDRPGLRISDADRERAAQRLHTALSEGRITLSELEERLAVVYAARYEADLRPPLADLPAEVPVAVTPAGPPMVLKAGMSTIKRTGPWRVPPRIRVLSGMGSVTLDFCDAENPHPVVEIELELGAGSAKLLVPDDAPTSTTSCPGWARCTAACRRRSSRAARTSWCTAARRWARCACAAASASASTSSEPPATLLP